MAAGYIERLEERHPRYSTSVDAGLAALRTLSGDQPLRDVADVADELGLSRSTAHRYLTTLVELGFAEQSASRKYRIATKGYDVGRAMLDSHPLCVQARPHLHEQSEEEQ
jgi:IclR family transcriptional regulator, pca regulon regulatory protein